MWILDPEPGPGQGVVETGGHFHLVVPCGAVPVTSLYIYFYFPCASVRTMVNEIMDNRTLSAEPLLGGWVWKPLLDWRVGVSPASFFIATLFLLFCFFFPFCVYCWGPRL